VAVFNSKPAASLSSALLARKGHARPAMRPQGFVGLTPASPHDDLGWNDMGGDEAHAPAPAKPPVLRQIEALDEQLSAPQAQPEPQPEAKPLPAAALAAVAREAAAKKTKAAFTLRLDPDRHLRLRLASAVTRNSAQQLVTQALDAFLESLTEVEALARQVDPAGKRG
jgi:hypothetical protein